MSGIDPDDVGRAARQAARRQRVQDAPAQQVVDDLRAQLAEPAPDTQEGAQS